MFRSSVAKLPFAATKTIVKAITRFNDGMNMKAIATAAAPPPNTQFIVQKAMPMNYAFSQGRLKWFYGMQQNLKYSAGLTKAPFLYTGYVSNMDGQPHGFGMKSSSHHTRFYSLYEEGEWRDGKLNGPAVRMLFMSGLWIETVAGIFVDGEPSQCRVVLNGCNNGIIFEGVFEGNGVKNGIFSTPEGVMEGSVEGSLIFLSSSKNYETMLSKCCPEVPARTVKKEVNPNHVSRLHTSAPFYLE
jgi:hypothetical protein